MFAKYGYGTMAVTFIVVAALILVGLYIEITILSYLFLVLGIGLALFTLYFFRDPNRVPPEGKNLLISPADGEVIVIKDSVENRYINEEVTQISIFMSPFNVHVNRIPIDGEVGYLKYHKGEYLVAYHDKADERNERMEIGIKSQYGKILFTQIAGFVARRIVCQLENGQNVETGKKFGMIKFGSRVDVYAPKNWAIKVKKGDKVSAGKTILFENINENN